MERDAWKVLLATGIGAGLGALIALEMIAVLWWIGPLVGGLIGYLSYEWKTVLRAIPVAADIAIEYSGKVILVPINIVVLAIFLLYFVLLPIIVVSLATLNVWLIYGGIHYLVDPNTFSMHDFVFIAAFSSTIISGSLILFWFVDGVMEDNTTFLTTLWTIFKYSFPPFFFLWTVPMVLVRYVLPFIWEVTFYGTPVVLRFCGRFFKELFIRIHSEKRLLRAVDAMLGATIGFFAGSVIIGAVMGAIIGLFDYEIVSKRWLHLKVS